MQNTDSRRRFTAGLMGRMVLTSILPSVAVLALVVGTNAYRKHGLMLENAKERLSLECAALAAWVDGGNQAANELTETLRVAEQELFGNREAASMLTKRLLEATPYATGMTVGYEPDADGNDATGAPQGAVTAEGRFLPYWFRDWKAGDRISLKLLSGMDAEDWYQGPKAGWERRRSLEPTVTEPYDYEGKLMITHGAPLVRDGRFAGVVGLDRDLDTLQAEVTRRADAMDVDIYLVTRTGRVVVASDGTGRPFRSDPDGWRTKPLAETPAAIALARMTAEGAGGSVERIDDPGAGGESFFASAAVEHGGWTLVMAVPSSNVTDPILRDTAATAAIAIAGVCVVSVFIFFPTRRLARRVVLAADAAQQVAAGDLTRAPIRSAVTDESGDLLRALDSMNDDLNVLVGQVRGASDELSSTSAELGTTARRQDEVVASFGASSAEIAAAVREITATGQELAHEMDHVNEVATSTAHLAQDGRVQLESMEGAMQSLDQATGSVADRLAAINEKAVNIGGVVTTITKVAEQTNLLSVNAAIEAEKAGEYGRGFLVVAREIRRLADQTGQATLDIERMVKEMQGAVSTGVMEMDRFSEQVRRNVSDVRSIGKSMTQIIGSVDESSRSFGTVREGMRSQAAGAAQISEAMASLSGNAKATADAVREFGRAAEHLQRSIGTLKTAIAAFQLRA